MKSNDKDNCGLIWTLLAVVIAGVALALTYSSRWFWKGTCWSCKQLYKKSPMVFRCARSATTWTVNTTMMAPAKKLMNMRPARPVYRTPDIFVGQANLAPAREFDLRKLNRLK